MCSVSGDGALYDLGIAEPQRQSYHPAGCCTKTNQYGAWNLANCVQCRHTFLTECRPLDRSIHNVPTASTNNHSGVFFPFL